MNNRQWKIKNFLYVKVDGDSKTAHQLQEFLNENDIVDWKVVYSDQAFLTILYQD